MLVAMLLIHVGRRQPPQADFAGADGDEDAANENSAAVMEFVADERAVLGLGQGEVLDDRWKQVGVGWGWVICSLILNLRGAWSYILQKHTSCLLHYLYHVMRLVPDDATRYSVAPCAKLQAVHITFEKSTMLKLLHVIDQPCLDNEAPGDSLLRVWRRSVSQDKLGNGANMTSFQTDGVSLSMRIAIPGAEELAAQETEAPRVRPFYIDF